MKKQLFAVMLLIGAVLLTGCKKGGGDTPTPDPDPQPQTDVKVEVSPKEAILTTEDPTIRLTATLTPADASVTIEWSSSDTLIATVTNRGFVEATGYGDCYIYATAGEAKDSCHVFVKSYLETLIFNGAIVWNEDTTYAQDPKTGEMKVDTIKSTSGETYYVYKSLALLRVFSDGFYVNSSGYIDGTEIGTIVNVRAPMFFAPGWLNGSDYNTVFCLGEWNVTNDLKYMRQGEPGKISDEAEYVRQLKLFMDGYNAGSPSATPLQAASALFTGATLSIWEYDADDEGYSYSYIPDAVCDEATLFLNGNYPASPYMCGIDYSEVKFTPLDYSWGMDIEYDERESKYVFVDEEIHWGDQIVSVYGEKPAESKAYTPLRVPIISEYPEIKARIEEQIKEKGIRVISAK